MYNEQIQLVKQKNRARVPSSLLLLLRFQKGHLDKLFEWQCGRHYSLWKLWLFLRSL